MNDSLPQTRNSRLGKLAAPAIAILVALLLAPTIVAAQACSPSPSDNFLFLPYNTTTGGDWLDIMKSAFDHHFPDYTCSMGLTATCRQRGMEIALWEGEVARPIVNPAGQTVCYTTGGTLSADACGYISGYYGVTGETTIFYDGHDGYDWAIQGVNPPILAAAGGQVTDVKDEGAYGWTVTIDHLNGYQTKYSHLQKDTLNPKKDTCVQPGDPIGVQGSTGHSTGPHLHFRVLHEGRLTDPFGWCASCINSPPDPLAAFNGETSRNLWYGTTPRTVGEAPTRQSIAIIWNAFHSDYTGGPGLLPSDAATPDTGPGGSGAGVTTTILLMDTSSSMTEPDSSGLAKLDAARRAAGDILDIIDLENRAAGGSGSLIGLVDFNSTASVDVPLTSDIAAAHSTVDNLAASGATAMPDGLRAALDVQARDSSRRKPIIILLSDGLPNIGLGGGSGLDPATVNQQVLGLADEAKQRGLCIYTIGLGIPSSSGASAGGATMDEDLLKQISAAASCGEYYSAQNARELADIYVRLRHTTTGNIIFNQTGNISQGERLTLSDITVPANQQQLLFTLNWPGSRVEPILTDPRGQKVDTNYPNAYFSITQTVATIIINTPLPGAWHVEIYGADVPEGTTTYNSVASTRAAPAAIQPTVVLPPSSSGAFPFALLVIAVVVTSVAVVVIAARRRQPPAPASPLPAETAPAATVSLTSVTGEMVGSKFPIPRSPFALGRSAECDLRLSASVVSRHHAQIVGGGNDWYVQDLNSATGTQLNGQPVSYAQLHTGDFIGIGSSVFRFDIDQ